MDAKSLAQKLGITAKTVSQRARILGISGTQTKIEGKEGRPAIMYNAEECDRIASYGKAQTPSVTAIQAMMMKRSIWVH